MNKKVETEVGGMYNDVDKNRWSYVSIEAVTKAGLMSGYPDGTFRPEQSLTREEIASILHRLLFRNGLFNDILPNVMPSVVLVHRGDALGSGACIKQVSGTSYIITNAHVVGSKTTFGLIKDDGTPNFTGELVAKDDSLDLAIVKTTRVLPALNISTELTLGQPIAVIGAPVGFTESVTVGVVSSLKRDKWIQIDAPINPGNSGGPVVNEKGEIVGVVVAKIPKIGSGDEIIPIEGMGFAIKAEVVKNFVTQVIGKIE